MRKRLFVWVAYIHLLGLWMNGLKKRIYLNPRDSKRDKLSSIISVLIFVLRLLLLLIMMSYLKVVLHLMGFIKITKRNSIQIKQS